MTSILYVGLDVHTTNYTICSYSFPEDRFFAEIQVAPDYHQILKYLDRVRSMRGGDCKFLCGYEAGCLGYSLYHQLTYHGVDCVILAPSTMGKFDNLVHKNDYRDARTIAKCLAFNTYKAVHVPTKIDEAVKDYMRMRDDANTALKTVKQQIIAYCTRHGFLFDGKSKWTKRHLDWLHGLDLGNPIMNEVLQEYMIRYYQLSEKVDMYDVRIEEFSQMDEYREDAAKLQCFIGVKTHTAMALLSEVGDFKRFESAERFAAYLGLVPRDHSSAENGKRLGITKAGNAHLRRLLVESANSYAKGKIGHKSKALMARQKGNSPQVIAYADKANERLRRKYYRLSSHTKRNIAVTAVARELACFVWGMMTEHYD
jgi:transposase